MLHEFIPVRSENEAVFHTSHETRLYADPGSEIEIRAEANADHVCPMAVSGHLVAEQTVQSSLCPGAARARILSGARAVRTSHLTGVPRG